MDETYQEATKLWEQMKTAKYSDDEIRELIDNAAASLKYEWNSCGMAEIAAAQTALAMITYNEMVDSRIERAQKSWDTK